MVKLVLVTGKEMSKIIESLGFERIHQIGSHIRYIHPDGRRTVVPVHGNETLSKGLILEILKQIQITKEEYENLR